MRLIILVLALLLPTVPASAQSGTYTKWQNPDTRKADAGRLQEFIDRLKGLVDKAEKAQAASPQFLRDLRDLATGFDRPWRTTVLDDTFADGNFTANPTWQVSSGEYWIEQGWGLRTSVEPARAATPAAEPKRVDNKDAAVAILGGILNQALGGKQVATPPQPSAPAVAVIHTNVALSNAFAVTLNFSAWSPRGRLEIAAFQGQFAGPDQSAGYRLVYQPEGRLELLRVSSRGTAIIDSASGLATLLDKKFHVLEWQRHDDGRMQVSLDGKAVLSTTDRGFRDRFSGIALFNRGGDYIFKQIRADGV